MNILKKECRKAEALQALKQNRHLKNSTKITEVQDDIYE